MKLIKSLFLLSALTFFIVSCEEDNSGDNSVTSNFIGLESYQTVEITNGNTVVVQGKIFASNVSNSDRTFNLGIDASTTYSAADFTVPATVTIPAGSSEGFYDVTIYGNNVNDEDKIVVSLEAQEGVYQATTYASYSNGVLTGVGSSKTSFVLYKPCSDTRAKLSITFDNYPEETAWELYDVDENLIDSAGFNAAGNVITGFAVLGYAGRSTYSFVKCLPSGTYTLVIYDKYGDGMYDGTTTEGSYSFMNLNNGAILAEGQGNFGSFAEHVIVID